MRGQVTRPISALPRGAAFPNFARSVSKTDQPAGAREHDRGGVVPIAGQETVPVAHALVGTGTAVRLCSYDHSDSLRRLGV